MKTRWTHSHKSVYNIGYHFIWCSKYRRKILVDKIEERLKILLYEKAKQIDTEIIMLEIMPEHIHMFVKTSPINSPHYIVQQFKGLTSNKLRKEFSELLKIPSLWTRSYYCETVGHISEKTIKRYIEEQKNV